MPEMSAARNGCQPECAAVRINWNVYVVGGASDAAASLASIKCYDPIATGSQWRTLPSMSSATSRRYSSCLAVTVACEM